MSNQSDGSKNKKQLDAARRLVASVAERLDCNVNVRLWDGSLEPLGRDVIGPLEISISGPGVIGALVRRPTLDNVIRHYIDKRIDFSGGTIIDLGRALSPAHKSGKRVRLNWLKVLRDFAPFVREPAASPPDTHGFAGDSTQRRHAPADNKEFVQFHYDLSNAFYELFLDPEMIYSCAYFTEWHDDIARAQRDKMDLICRKLRLTKGDRLLDVGSGWGGLVRHAAQHYGVTAHGITLSEEQLSRARERATNAGLEDQLTFELTDYRNVTGKYNKIVSVGMYEHIGLKERETYFAKVRSLLTDDGLYLHHAITRRAPKPRLIPRRLRPEQRALAKYIFPGGELDDIGRTLVGLERAGFEVHDMEGLRRHYQRTCELWSDRLIKNREAAIAEVGEAKYRIFTVYLGACALAFERGSARLFQTVSSKTPRHPQTLPLTRSDLYE